jgi:hypothetical protein
MTDDKLFMALYLDPAAENWQDKIVIHEPLANTLSAAMIPLQSQRLEGLTGMVMSGTDAQITAFLEGLEEWDIEFELGLKANLVIMDALADRAGEFGLTVEYVQGDAEELLSEDDDVLTPEPAPEEPIVDEPAPEPEPEVEPEPEEEDELAKQRESQAGLLVGTHGVTARSLSRLMLSNLRASFEGLPIWTPAQVQEKLARVVELVNAKLPEGLFLQKTVEETDDIPVVRVLIGPNDPYTAERIGSFAFYSTQRGMEWLLKQDVGNVQFLPHQGMVPVTYYDDFEKGEKLACTLSLTDADESWAQALFQFLESQDYRRMTGQVNQVAAPQHPTLYTRSEFENFLTESKLAAESHLKKLAKAHMGVVEPVLRFGSVRVIGDTCYFTTVATLTAPLASNSEEVFQTLHATGGMQSLPHSTPRCCVASLKPGVDLLAQEITDSTRVKVLCTMAFHKDSLTNARLQNPEKQLSAWLKFGKFLGA